MREMIPIEKAKSMVVIY
jgi:hypothetical protein